MKIELILGRELDTGAVREWREIQHSNSELCSTFFAPEFTLKVSANRGDVEIAVFKERGKVLGFFPFQRQQKKIGLPVGHPLSDYHGVIGVPGLDFDPLALLRACHLAVWDFDHVLVSQKPFEAFFHPDRAMSPIINLPESFEKYVADQKSAGSSLRVNLQLMRKIEREIGPLLLKHDVDDVNTLHFIMQNKSQQYKRSGVPDLFAQEWIRKTVEDVLQTKTPHFSGMLSTLYAGSERVAALMSIRSSNVMHAWFLGFEERFLKYSPGFLLYFKIIEIGHESGFRYLDFGKGDQPYKLRLMNGSIPLAQGSVERPSFLSLRRDATRKLRRIVTSSLLAGPARRIVHWAQSLPSTRDSRQ